MATSFEQTQNLIAQFKQSIAAKEAYIGHIPALKNHLEALIRGYGIFLFSNDVIRKAFGSQVDVNTKHLLSYASENLFNKENLGWVNRADIDVSFMTGGECLRLLIKPQYLINNRVFVKPIEIKIDRLLEIYALSERNEQQKYIACINQLIDPWERHNPYIDDELDNIQSLLNQGVLSVKDRVPVDDVQHIVPAIKHLIFILVESMFLSIESLKINKSNLGCDLVFTKNFHGKTLTNSSVFKTENKGSILSALNISHEKYLDLNNIYPSVSDYTGWGADDWIYFRVAHNHKFAISPSLGIKRYVNIAEYYNISSFD